MRFRGNYYFLSNFYPAKVLLDGVEYPTVEHAYQAAKSLNQAQRESVRLARTPGEAKRIGRSLQTRPDWENIKVSVMYHLLEQKFSIPELRDLLLATGSTILVEENTWGDTFWGVCGKGSNVLGTLLMIIRSQLKKGSR